MIGKGFSVFISCLLLVFSLGIFVSFTSTAHAIDISEEASNYCLLLPDNENIDIGSYEELQIMLRDYEEVGASAIEGECDQEANFCVRSVEDPENNYIEAEFLSEASEYLNEFPNADVSTLEEDSCEDSSTEETQECDSSQAVCSVNDYTYESECLAQQEGVEYTNGACEEQTDDSSTSQECDSDQKVCSEYGYTYQSECLAQNEGVDYTLGACEDSSSDNSGLFCVYTDIDKQEFEIKEEAEIYAEEMNGEVVEGPCEDSTDDSSTSEDDSSEPIQYCVVSENGNKQGFDLESNAKDHQDTLQTDFIDSTIYEKSCWEVDTSKNKSAKMTQGELNSLPEFEESSSDSKLSDKKCKNIQGVEICSGDLLKTPNNPAVYSITYDIVDTVKDEGLQVMPIRNPQVYFTYADSWDEIKVIERPSVINSMRSIGFAPSKGANLNPVNIKVGTLVTTPFTNNVYLRAKDGLYLFNSADSLRNQGYELSDIIDISPRLMSKMKNAFSLYEVNENTELLNGLLYKDSSSPDVFFKMDDKKMKFDSLSELKSFASEHNVNINKIPETSGINNFPDDPLLKNSFPDDPLSKRQFPDDPL